MLFAVSLLEHISATSLKSYEDPPCEVYKEHIKYMIQLKKKKIEVRCLHTIS